MVTQMVVRGRPILCYAPLAEQADSDVAVPGTGKRAIKRLQDAREARGAGLCWIQMSAQFAMLGKVGQAAKGQSALHGHRRGCKGGRQEAKPDSRMDFHSKMKLAPAFCKQNVGGAGHLFNRRHLAAQSININGSADGFLWVRACLQRKDFVAYHASPGREGVACIQMRIFEPHHRP